MSASSADPATNTRLPGQSGYYAVLTVPTGPNRSVAAKGQNCDTIVGALRSLFDVTAAALVKYQGNILNNPGRPGEIAGGLIDESLV